MNNEITISDFIPFIQKAALLDAIVNYVKNAKYITKEDLLALVGETVEEDDDE